MSGSRIGSRSRSGLLRTVALDVTELNAIVVLKVIARSANAREPVIHKERPEAVRLGARCVKHATIRHRRARKTPCIRFEVRAASSRHKLLEYRLSSRVFIGRKRKLSQGHHRLLGVVAVGITRRHTCDLGRHRNSLALVRVIEPRRSLDGHRRRNVHAGERGIVFIFGIAFSVTSKPLAFKATADRDLRVVLGLRKHKILVRDNARLARLKQTIGILRATGQLAEHETIMAGGFLGGVAPINRRSQTGPLTIHFQRCMKVSSHIGDILPVKNTQVEGRLRKAEIEQFGIKLVLILRGNGKVERPACRDFGVRLVGHREGDLGVRLLGTRQRLVDRALITVERDVVGARGILDLVVFAVDADVLGARHLQVGGQAVLVRIRFGVGVLDVVVGKGRIDLRLQSFLVGSDLFGVALDGHRKVVRALNVRRAAAHKRNGRRKRNVAIAREARHLAGVVAQAITGRPNDVAVGALPANLELALGAHAVRKREVGRNRLGRIARSVADGNLLGGIVEHLLHASLVPSNLHRLVRPVVLGLAVA